MQKGSNRPRIAPPKTIFVDVDGTLIINGQVNKALVAKLEVRKALGFELVLWSMRGRVYAEKIARKTGTHTIFNHIISKPGEIIDDRGKTWLRYVKETKP